jgi:hypothetical protein
MACCSHSRSKDTKDPEEEEDHDTEDDSSEEEKEWSTTAHSDPIETATPRKPGRGRPFGSKNKTKKSSSSSSTPKKSRRTPEQAEIYVEQRAVEIKAKNKVSAALHRKRKIDELEALRAKIETLESTSLQVEEKLEEMQETLGFVVRAENARMTQVKPLPPNICLATRDRNLIPASVPEEYDSCPGN